MSRLLLTAAVLAVLVYTMVLGVRWLSPRIEQDIAERVTTGLAEQGLLWADVSVEGRDVVLSGTAPDADAKNRALNVVTRVFGVSKVTDNLSVVGDVSNTVVAMVSGTTVSDTKVIAMKPETKAEKKAEAAKAAAAAKAATPVGDYALTITKEGEKVALEGNVPDEASKKVLMDLATNRYTAANVDGSKLTVVEGAPAGWRSAVGAVLMHISNMEEAKVLISGTEVMVSGSVLDKEYSDKMEKDVSQVLPKTYKAAFAVDVVTPTVADVAPAAGDEVSATDVSATTMASCDSKVDLTKQTLMFGFDKADLTATHQARLKTVAGYMKGCAAEKVVLAGYTDVTGSKLYNKWLSQQRAEAAMRGLMRDGVAKDRLKAIGYGELYPVAPNTTKTSRAKNRRVEFDAGDVLPHDVNAPAVETPVAAPVKAAPVKTHKVKHVVSKTVIKVVKPADVSGTVVSGTVAVSDSAAISKPWWARKKVSETAVDAQ